MIHIWSNDNWDIENVSDDLGRSALKISFYPEGIEEMVDDIIITSEMFYDGTIEQCNRIIMENQLERGIVK